MLKPKIISIETRKCCHCGKTLYNKSEQFVLTQKLVVCSACWDGSKANPFNRVSTEPVANLVHFPDKLALPCLNRGRVFLPVWLRRRYQNRCRPVFLCLLLFAGTGSNHSLFKMV